MKILLTAVATFCVVVIAAVASGSQAQEERRKEENKVMSCWERCGAGYVSCLQKDDALPRDEPACRLQD